MDPFQNEIFCGCVFSLSICSGCWDAWEGTGGFYSPTFEHLNKSIGCSVVSGGESIVNRKAWHSWGKSGGAPNVDNRNYYSVTNKFSYLS